MNKAQAALPYFLIIVFCLTVVGLIFIYSASSVYSLEKLGCAHFFLKKHMLGLLLGVIGLVLCQAAPLSTLEKWAPLCFILTLCLTLLTKIPGYGVTIHGSTRWLSLGFFSFQPSEVLKLGFILYIASFLTRKQYTLSSLTRGYIPFLIITGLTAFILLLQPDFGQAVTFTTTALMLFFVVHTSMRHVMYTIVPLLPVGMLLILMKPYRFQRILTFLNPWQDPQGSGFQIIQSLIAIGSGGLWGVGIAQSRQKFFYLPMQHTDFIFSIIAEETGFVGTTILLTLYILFLYYGVRLAWYCTNTFACLTILGCVLLTTLQTLINICVATGLLPTKGIGLPFISYGNSALIVSLCMVGIIIACVREGTEKAA